MAEYPPPTALGKSTLADGGGARGVLIDARIRMNIDVKDGNMIHGFDV